MTYPLRKSDSGFAADILDGLMGVPKTLPAKYFYDARGSLLFEEICDLPEYYPTRVETALLKRHAREIAARAGEGVTLVEFGAGALKKVELLLAALPVPAAYMPIDISGEFLESQAAALRARRPGLVVRPVVADFAVADLPPLRAGERRIGFFPGSTIGNFDPDEACAFLRRARNTLSAMLVGVDLVKAPHIVHAAYNDAAGITAAFNKNVLLRINRELGADFDPASFDHYAFYDPRLRRIEMHLVSKTDQRVEVLSRGIDFMEGEPIHTESSYKYTVGDFQDLALAAGYLPAAAFVDGDRQFSLHWLEPAG
ncbi:L-histidine N(alpha)-methyltransferase [Rhizomicrobium electricum]|uniref:L-histidine N(Alpha)-methyltransferase n=1 Tax=Rhizomicrobium electricum TaxID=480070 RepID=A0ABN1E7B6_9PROT